MLLSIEVLIALYITQHFIRHVFGDYLCVIMLYYFFKSFLKTNTTYIALIVLLIAYSIEFLQLINILDILQLRHHKILIIIIGTTFSIEDLVAYTLGIITVILTEKYLIGSQLSNQVF